MKTYKLADGSSVQKIREGSEAETWRSVPGVKMIWHGAWNDPELQYKDRVVNYYDVENALWDEFKDDCDERGVKADAKDDAEFNKYCKEHASEIYMLIESLSKDRMKESVKTEQDYLRDGFPRDIKLSELLKVKDRGSRPAVSSDPDLTFAADHITVQDTLPIGDDTVWGRTSKYLKIFGTSEGYITASSDYLFLLKHLKNDMQ